MSEPPANQAARSDASPLNGVVAPVEHRFKPGFSGNPAGRPTAGSTIREWINQFAANEHTEQELRAIARDKTGSWPKRTAAERILRTLEAGDLADFAGLMSGENSLEDLRGMGINTEVVKKFKQKTRKMMVGKGDEAQVEEVIEREIELHDRAGDDFDRVVENTDGKPRQPVEVTQRRTVADGVDEASRLFAELQESLGLHPRAASPDETAVK